MNEESYASVDENLKAQCGLEMMRAAFMGASARFAGAMLTIVLVGSSDRWSLASGVDRSPEQIVREIDAIEIPRYDPSKKNDSTYSRQFLETLRNATVARSTLIRELFKASPDHPRMPGLMAERWSVRPYGVAADQQMLEAEDVLAHSSSQKLKVEAAFARAYLRVYPRTPNGPVDLANVDLFLGMAPEDPRGAVLLELAANRAHESKEIIAIEDRLLREFPDSRQAQKIRGAREKAERVGKPFELDFVDAIGGLPVSIKKLRGRVVVIDFWATWCVPCVAEMPAMKSLYEKYHRHGVEFIGVSLDLSEAAGGLKSLRKYVKENAIAWPQYYQGDGWDSAFSLSCGINQVPTVFVVDTDGKLYSTDGRGKLDAMIPKLLEKVEKAEVRGHTARPTPEPVAPHQ